MRKKIVIPAKIHVMAIVTSVLVTALIVLGTYGLLHAQTIYFDNAGHSGVILPLPGGVTTWQDSSGYSGTMMQLPGNITTWQTPQGHSGTFLVLPKQTTGQIEHPDGMPLAQFPASGLLPFVSPWAAPYWHPGPQLDPDQR